MTRVALSDSKKSTTVRSLPAQVIWLRRGLRALSAVAPGLAESMAADLFFRPRRSSKARPPEVPGLERQNLPFESRGLTLQAWSWGTGPAVLLPHGWEGWGGQMTAFVPAIVAAGMRAVTLDMPGHGLSEGRNVSVLDFAHALGKLAKLSGPVHGIIAHSMGGTATSLALSEGLQAQRVVLLAPGAEPRYFARRAAAFLDLPEARTEGMLRRILDRFGGSWVEHEIPNLVRAVQVPMLLLHDPADDDVPWSHGESIAAAWPEARIEAVQGVGHRRILGDAAVVKRAMDFLGRPEA